MAVTARLSGPEIRRIAYRRAAGVLESALEGADLDDWLGAYDEADQIRIYDAVNRIADQLRTRGIDRG
jgi:hypothetical protein